MYLKSGGKVPSRSLLPFTLLVMKLTAFFLLFTMLHVCTPAVSQQVSISGKDLSLEQIFTEIKKQTGLDFFYESALLKGSKPVTLNVVQMPVDEVLKICLQGQGLGFNIRSGTIIIFKEEASSGNNQPTPTDTSISIKGQVVDARGVPVEMASVVLERTKAGTQTDRSGIFLLKVRTIQPGDSLNISFIGYRTTYIQPASKTDLGQVVLQMAENVLDQAMIIAYGTTTEKYRTGDITTVKAADIEKTPALNVIEALSGRVPGLYVRQNGSNPGSIYNIQLRGLNVMPPDGGMAVGGATDVLSKPLIVLDGLPLAPDVINSSGQHTGVDAMTGMTGAGGGQDPLYWLNPLDVESITVLKDADATALYGSRAANGVIMITTKKGKPGKNIFNIVLNTGINAQARKLKLLNTQQYLAMRHEAWSNTMAAGLPVQGGLSISYTPDAANAYDFLVWDTTRHTDWQDFLLGSAPVHNINVGLSGGEGVTSYRISASYNRWKNSYPHLQGKPGFREEKGTMSFSFSTRSSNNRLKFTASALASTMASVQPVFSPDEYIFLAPNAPAIFDATGNFNFADWRPASIFPSLMTGNPLGMLGYLYRSNRFNIFTRTSFSYELYRSLVFTLSAGYARSDGKQLMNLPSAAIDPIVMGFTRAANFGNSNSAGFNIEPALRYVKRFGRHYVDVLAGASYQSDKQEGRIVIAYGYATDELMGSPDAATTVYNFTNIVQRKSISSLGRISYRYADEWLLDLSGRVDGSSSFGPGRRYGNFGSIGWGWIFTKGLWSKQIPFLTFGKIRGSYGITGIQSSNPYAYMSTFRPSGPSSGQMPILSSTSTNGIYQGIQTLTITRIANSSLGWAEAVGIDLGLDLYFLQDQRLKLSIQWYNKRTGDQLVTTPVSLITGTNEYMGNMPVKVENSGWEVMIDYAAPQTNKGFQWYVHMNIAANRNKLLSYPGLENSILKNYFELGQSLATLQLFPTFVHKELGVYSVADPANPRPATSYFVRNYPDFFGGLQAGISYKGLSLSLNCTFAKQKGFNNTKGAGYPGELTTFAKSNQPLSVIRERHWQSPADSAIGGAFHAGFISYSDRLDINWGDASYIALKTITLNYDLPQTILKKTAISSCSFYIRSENLLLLPVSGYKGANPEQPGLSAQLPLRMVLVSGVTINF